MKRIIITIIIIFSLFPSSSFADISLPHTHHWDTIAPWDGPFNGGPSIDTTESAPGSPSSSIRYTYPTGTPGGVSPGQTLANFSVPPDELWIQYWFKYSAGWTLHGVLDKHVYLQINTANSPDFFLGTGYIGDPTRTVIALEPSNGNPSWLEGNRGFNPNVYTGDWVKATIHFKLNTIGSSNGVCQVWIDDGINNGLVIDYNDVLLLGTVAGESGGKFSYIEFTPVWGGDGNTKPKTEYFWVDHTQIQTTPFTGEETDPPSVISQSPSSGETNWPVASQNVTFNVTDATNVDRSTLSFWITGEAPRACDATGLSCTPAGDTTNLSVTYTRGSTWEYNTTYTANVDVYDTLVHRQQTNWQFTTQSAPADPNPPVLGTQSPSSGETNWPTTNRVVSFDISDDVELVDTSLIFSVGGTSGSSFTDTFNRADETPIGDPWETNTSASGGGLVLYGNGVAGGTIGRMSGYKTSAYAFSADQYNQIKIVSLPTVINAKVYVRAPNNALTGYFLHVYKDASLSTWQVYRQNAGAETPLSTATNRTWNVGDILKIQAIGTGSTVTIIAYVNGAVLGTWDDTSASRILFGQPALQMYGMPADQAFFDDWEGGDLSGTQSCLSGLSCSWVTPNKVLHAVYTRGTDWASSTVYTINIQQARDTSNNNLSTSWNFTTQAGPVTPRPPTDIEIHVESP